MSLILNLLLLLIVSMIFAVILRSKRQTVPRKQWFSKKTTFSIVGLYILFLLGANVVDAFLPTSSNAMFQPVEKSVLWDYDKQHRYLNEGNPEKVDASYIVDTWTVKASDNQISLKPRTIGELPVYVIVERTSEVGDTATATLFKGTMVADNFILPGYSDYVDIQLDQSTLIISSNASNHFELASFKMNPMMHQFTRYSYEEVVSTSESLPILYLEMPKSMDLLMDKSIKMFINELDITSTQ